MQYKLLRSPAIFASDERYLLCQAEIHDESGDNPAAGDVVVFLILRASVTGPLRAGRIIEGGELVYVPEVNALVLEDFAPGGQPPKAVQAVPVQEVPPSVPSDPRVPQSENGWGDDDDIVSVAQQAQQQAPRQRMTSSPQRQPNIGATVDKRRQAILEAGDKIPLDLLASLRITAHSYNLVAALIGAGGKPGPQDVRALVITNIISWAKTANPTEAAPEELLKEAEEQLERVIKEYA